MHASNGISFIAGNSLYIYVNVVLVYWACLLSFGVQSSPELMLLVVYSIRLFLMKFTWLELRLPRSSMNFVFDRRYMAEIMLNSCKISNKQTPSCSFTSHQFKQGGSGRHLALIHEPVVFCTLRAKSSRSIVSFASYQLSLFIIMH